MDLYNKNSKIYPFIDTLVDSLFTKEINDLLENDNVKEDKNTFLMFITIYFTTRLYAVDKSVSKKNIKNFMTELIKNPEKRRKCIDLFYNMNIIFTENIEPVENKQLSLKN